MTSPVQAFAAPVPRRHRLRRAARTLRRPFMALISLVLAPLTSARIRRSRPVVDLAIAPADSLPRVAVAATIPGWTGAETARRSVDRLVLAEVEVIEVDAAFSEPRYATVLDQLQRSPGAKLLDLRAAPAIKIGLFDRLARDWTAPRGTVPRLGILLGFEEWTVLRHVAARRMRPLADRGVTVETFYPLQADTLPGWFAGGDVRHDRLSDVIAWLRTEWRPGPIWPTVLGRTASLVQASADVEAVPELLLELAALARTFAGSEGAENAARLAHAALTWLGDQPSSAQCRALRIAAAAKLSLGQTEAALALLVTAMNAATELQDPIELASGLAEIGRLALRRGQAAHGEARFRDALTLLSTDGPAELRAALHHGLALALHAQRKNPDEAERHATTALRLRGDPGSQLAREDRALLALICARRASPGRFARSDRSPGHHA
jgi:tetratricopeptide (TPR) repeat protein